MAHKFLLLTCISLFILINISYPQQMIDVNIQVFPKNHALNMPIDQLPVHPNSDAYIESIGKNEHLHPDFGTEWDNIPIGIPYNVVGEGQPLLPITFVSWPDESDAGPWPIPQDPYIETVFDWQEESNGDRHMLIVDTTTYLLYETGRAFGNVSGTEWEGSCGAIFHLNSNELRPDTWTSADAAGLPVFPLLIRYDEVEHAVQTGGEIPHAIRFTVDTTQKAYVWPARHYASPYTNPQYPPMGMRFRLKSDFNISGFSPRIQALLRTFKKYGLIISDNGSNWFIQGTHDDRWNDEELGELKSIEGSNFEAVDISPWLNSPEFDPNSAEVPDEGVVGIESEYNSNSSIPLFQNYPNPFSGKTTIAYKLTSSSDVQLEIIDLNGFGLLVYQFTNQSAGYHEFMINMEAFSDGIYIYKLITGEGDITKRLDLIK